MSPMFLVMATVPERTSCIALCATNDTANRQAVKFMAGHMDREPWIQTGSATWELRSRRERVEIIPQPVIE